MELPVGGKGFFCERDEDDVKVHLEYVCTNVNT